ncbi:MAG: geranylgeranyl reductase family protein [Candidatus Thorarchaeota archaeon]
MSHDLIVVGGGPAGSTCARSAALLGLDVLVLEKSYHPRRKACGGGLTLRVRDSLDFDFSAVVEREQCGQNLYSPKGLLGRIEKPDVAGYTVRREDFDHFLLNKAEDAGATIQQGVHVTDIAEESNLVRVMVGNETHSARLVVGADGPNSTVARKTGLKTRWLDDEIALCIESTVPLDSSEILRIVGDPSGSERIFIEIYFGFIEYGYAWAFAKKNEISLGFGGLVSELDDLKGKWKQFVSFFENAKGIKCDLSQQTAARVPVGGMIEMTCTKNIMLLGDAAGLVRTTTAEGIFYAIESAKIAAEVANDIISGKPGVDTMTYHKKAWDAFSEDLFDAPHPIFKSISKRRGNVT